MHALFSFRQGVFDTGDKVGFCVPSRKAVTSRAGRWLRSVRLTTAFERSSCIFWRLEIGNKACCVDDLHHFIACKVFIFLVHSLFPSGRPCEHISRKVAIVLDCLQYYTSLHIGIGVLRANDGRCDAEFQKDGISGRDDKARLTNTSSACP